MQANRLGRAKDWTNGPLVRRAFRHRLAFRQPTGRSRQQVAACALHWGEGQFARNSPIVQLPADDTYYI